MRHEREHAEQVALFQWADIQSRAMPELRLMFAIPNAGQRHPIVGQKMRAEGLRAGVPDIFLPVARGGFHGAFIEMKAKGGRTRKNQDQWIESLREQGYFASVCVGWSEAAQRLTWYLRQRVSR